MNIFPDFLITSSKKIIDGLCSRARAKSSLTSLKIGSFSIYRKKIAYFSESPSHLVMRSDSLTEKNVDARTSAATASAMRVLPFPGGPNKRIPFHGSQDPILLHFMLILSIQKNE